MRANFIAGSRLRVASVESTTCSWLRGIPSYRAAACVSVRRYEMLRCTHYGWIALHRRTRYVHHPGNQCWKVQDVGNAFEVSKREDQASRDVAVEGQLGVCVVWVETAVDMMRCYAAVVWRAQSSSGLPRDAGQLACITVARSELGTYCFCGRRDAMFGF